MSNGDDKKDYDVGYAKPPKNTRFGQLGGNPINLKGAPKKDDDMKRFSMDSFRKSTMNDAHKKVEIVENGQRKIVSQIYVIISRLNNTKTTKNVLMLDQVF